MASHTVVFGIANRGCSQVLGGAHTNVHHSSYPTAQVPEWGTRHQDTTEPLISQVSLSQLQTINRGRHNHPTHDHITSNLQALRNTADTHQRVNQRYQELVQATNFTDTGNLDLLLDTLQRQDKVKIKWPQDMAFIGTHERQQTYLQLTSMK